MRHHLTDANWRPTASQLIPVAAAPPGELRAAMQLPVYTAGPSLAGTKQAADLVGRTSPSCTGGPISRKF